KRMNAAKRNSASIWTGTKWLTTFLGASGPITFGLELTGDRNLDAFRLLAVAAAGAIVGGLAYGLTTAIAQSQIRKAAEIEASKRRRRVGAAVATCSLLLQLAALLALFGGQVLALRIALHTGDLTPNDQLASGLKDYRGSASVGIDRIREVCAGT